MSYLDTTQVKGECLPCASSRHVLAFNAERKQALF